MHTLPPRMRQLARERSVQDVEVGLRETGEGRVGDKMPILRRRAGRWITDHDAMVPPLRWIVSGPMASELVIMLCRTVLFSLSTTARFAQAV